MIFDPELYLPSTANNIRHSAEDRRITLVEEIGKLPKRQVMYV